LLAQPFAQRLGGDERLKLGDEVAPAEGEVAVDPQLERFPAQLLETRDLHLRKRRVREIGEGRPAPECERRAHLFGGLLVVAAIEGFARF
jgi:hypothetical protein